MKQFSWYSVPAVAAAALILVPQTGSSFSRAPQQSRIAEPQARSVPEGGTERTLDQVLDRNLSGLPSNAAELEKLRDYAQQYIETKKQRASASGCDSSENSDNPFCKLTSERTEPTTRNSGAQARTARLSRTTLKKINQDLKKEHYDALSNIPEPAIMAVLKRLSPSEFEKLANSLANSPGCPGTPLLASAGLRLEEKLPDARIQSLLFRIYERAISCSPNITEDGSAIKAAYRLGLHRVAAGEYAKADELFSKIVTAVSVFRTRILYWRNICAQKLGNPDLQAETRKALLREAPLSLHNLMLSGSSLPVKAASLLNDTVPQVLFRSASRPDLNPTVVAAELMQLLNRPELAYKILNASLDSLQAAEPEFQLYYSVLLMRSGDVLKKFQLITSLFREHPSYISRSTMRMLYPLRSLELMDRVNTQDPFLIVSLIRQESAFNHKARSPAGALGLMQVMPMTARKMERQTQRRHLMDPQINVRIGVKYFNRLMEQYDGAAELALAAYNAGPERVNDWVKRYPVEDRLLFVDLIPFRETREYVASIVRNYYFYLKLYEQEYQRRTPQKPAFGKSPLFSFLDQEDRPGTISRIR